MKLVSVQSGQPKTYGDATKKSFGEREWHTGFYKQPVSGSVEVTRLGLAGDGQADLKVHGGPDKAICAYPCEHFGYWKELLGLEMANGAFGENFTTSQGTENDVCIGDIFQIDDVVLQITQPRQPCWKLSRRWQTKNLAALVQENGRTGWYFRVLQEGKIKTSGEMRLTDRPNGQWTIEKCNQVMHHLRKDREQGLALANIAELSESWKSSLLKRAQGPSKD
ncbi:MAG: MOSC domain-containing protein [Verrucomicrobiota bacterium]